MAVNPLLPKLASNESVVHESSVKPSKDCQIGLTFVDVSNSLLRPTCGLPLVPRVWLILSGELTERYWRLSNMVASTTCIHLQKYP